MKRSLTEIAAAVGGRALGNANQGINGVASIESAAPGDLVFVEDEKHLPAALSSNASALIAGEFAASVTNRPLIISAHPKLAFARAAILLCDKPSDASRGVHPTAVVHPTAKLEPCVHVGERAVIGERVQVGENTIVEAGCVIGANVALGRNCRIYPNVTIYPGSIIGDRVIVHAGAVLGSDGFGYVQERATGHYEKFPQVGRLVIEDDVEIGANTTIDRGALDETRIRRGVKLDNLVHIGHNCDIGEDVVIAAQTGLSGSIVIEKGAVLGGQVGIGERARIGEGVMLGGQGGVLPNKILRGKGVAFWGTPAQPLRQYLKQLAMLARLARKD